MTYEDRQRYRLLVEGVTELRSRLESGTADGPVTREEALALLDMLEGMLDRLSPERFDRLMETVVEEAARRAGALAIPRRLS